MKRDIRELDETQILRKLQGLKVSYWRYWWNRKQVRHAGPMAQDFRAAFGLGESDRAIDLIDANGVLFAAVKALANELEEKEERIARLEQALINKGGRSDEP